MSKTDPLDVFSMGLGTIVPKAEFGALLLWGGYGSGKTWFALSASRLEEHSPMLVIDTENSTSGVIDQFRQRDPEDPTNIEFDPELGGIIDVVRPLEQWGANAYVNTMSLLDEVAKGNTIYKSVSIDVADLLQAWGLQYHEKASDGFYKWGQIDQDLTGAPLPDSAGKNKALGLFYRLKMSKVLTFLVVHEKIVEQEEGPPLSSFQWGGQGKGKIGGIVDGVFYFRRRAKGAGAETTLFTVGSATFNAKNRFTLANKYTNPAFSDILAEAKKNGGNK